LCEKLLKTYAGNLVEGVAGDLGQAASPGAIEFRARLTGRAGLREQEEAFAEALVESFRRSAR
jgi:hypothetical protein